MLNMRFGVGQPLLQILTLTMEPFGLEWEERFKTGAKYGHFEAKNKA